MPTINIGGQRVIVGDEFLKMSPEEQNAAVDEIAQSLPKSSTASGMAKSFGAGLAKGALGMASMAANPMGAGVQMVRPDSYNPSSPVSMQQTIEGATGEWRKPQGSGEEFAERTGQLVPGMFGGPGSAATRVATQVLAPAAGGQIGKELTRGTKYEPYGEIAGMVGGGITGSGARAGIDKLTGHNVTKHRADALNVLKREGVEPTAGQATGNDKLWRREAQRGGQKYQNALENQALQYTGGAAKKAGFTDNRLTPPVIDKYLDDIGAKFDDAAAKSTAELNRGHSIRAMKIVEDYKNSVEGTPAPIVEKLAGTFMTEGRRQLTGENYKRIRTNIDEHARKASSSSQKEALYELRGLLDDAVESSIDPAIKMGWKEIRRQYRNWITLEKAVDPTTGLVSPASLQRAASSGKNKRGYLRGRSDYTELGNAGDLILTKPPSSGSIENLMSHVNKAMAKGSIGATIGHMTGIPGGALIGGAIGVGAPWARDKMLMSPWYQKMQKGRIRTETPEGLFAPNWAGPLVPYAGQLPSNY